ncbi:MAG: hypothetical protein IAE85_21275 [Anaerolinea sp.]|nr:hypothetical protein [Anaerolinea sp.]
MPNLQHLYPAEASAIYRALFGRDIPPILAQRFLPVIERLNAAASPAELADYYRAIETQADLEALELAGRLTGRLPLLTRKMQAMVTLAETLPENQPLYVNRRSSFLAGAAAMAWAAAHSVRQGVKGLWLLRGGAHG